MAKQPTAPKKSYVYESRWDALAVHYAQCYIGKERFEELRVKEPMKPIAAIGRRLRQAIERLRPAA